MSCWEREREKCLNVVGPQKQLTQLQPVRPVAPTGQTGPALADKKSFGFCDLSCELETNGRN